MLYKALGHSPVLPWISYRAASKIEAVLDRDSNILEFGSGMSTVWFAKRFLQVHSIEHDPNWYHRVVDLLKRHGLNNVQYELRASADYANLSESSNTFDFCIVDGINRLQCVESVLPRIRPGGYIFLDNSDVNEPERRRTVDLICGAAEERDGQVEFFVDFAPTQIHANQGLLAQL